MALATHISSVASKLYLCMRRSWGKEQKPTGLSMQRRAEQGKQRQGRVPVGSHIPASLHHCLLLAASQAPCVSCPGSSLPLGARLLQTCSLLSTASDYSTSYWSWAQGLRLCPGLSSSVACRYKPPYCPANSAKCAPGGSSLVTVQHDVENSAWGPTHRQGCTSIHTVLHSVQTSLPVHLELFLGRKRERAYI